MAKLHGKLKVDDFGYTMPVQAPDVGPPPYYYRGAEIIYVEWETDYEVVSQLVPEELVFAHDPPHAWVTFGRYPFCSSLGAYNEVAIYMPVLFEDRQYNYPAFLYVNQETPLIAGREIWAVPKKLAEVIEVKFEREIVMGYLERPAGNRLCTVAMQPEKNMGKEKWVDCPMLFVKLIPHPTLGHKPEICELVECNYQMSPIVGSDGMAEVWTGKGSIMWNSPTAIDPLDKIPVHKVVQSIYGRFNMYLPDGKVVKKYV